MGDAIPSSAGLPPPPSTILGDAIPSLAGPPKPGERVVEGAADSKAVSSLSGSGPLPGSKVPGAKTEAPTLPRVFSHYVLLEEIGRGGIGVVYRALDPALDRWVAIKVLSGRSLEDPDMIRRFDEEAHAVAALSHPGIVPLYEAGEFEGTHYIAMEFVEGKTLDRRKRKDLFAPAEALRIVLECAEALHFAHTRGIIHRDVKPSNIVLDPAGRIRLLDFGLAKREDVEKGITRTGEIVGTPAYMSPEQVEGDTDLIGPRTDVYGLGTVLYEMLTGHPPFDGKTAIEVLFNVRDTDPIPPRQLNPRVHRDVESICLKAMDKIPARRYASADELAEDIRRFLGGEPVLARGLTIVTRIRRGFRRHRSAAVALLALAAAMAAAAVTFAVLSARPPAAEPEPPWEAAFEDPLNVRKEGWKSVAGEPAWTESGLRLDGPRHHAVRLEGVSLRHGMAVEVRVRALDPEALGEVSIGLVSAQDDRSQPMTGYQFSIGALGNTRARLALLDREMAGEAMGVRFVPNRTYRLRLEHSGGLVRAFLDGQPLLEQRELFQEAEWVRGFHVELATRGASALFTDLRVLRQERRLRIRLMDLADRQALEGDSERAREGYDEIAKTAKDQGERDLAALKAILCRSPGRPGAAEIRSPLKPFPPEALQALQREIEAFLRSRPDSRYASLARLERARLLFWRSEFKPALETFDAVRADPSDPLATGWKYLLSSQASLFLMNGRIEDAIRLYEEAIRRLDGDPQLRAVHGKWLGRAWLYLGDAPKAVEAFRAAAEMRADPGESLRSRLEEIEALRLCGKFPEAMALCEACLKDPEAPKEGLSGPFREAQIRLMSQQGRRAEALALVREETGPIGSSDQPKAGRMRFWILRAELEADAGKPDEGLRILGLLEASEAGSDSRSWVLPEMLALRFRILSGAGRAGDALEAAERLGREIRRVPRILSSPWPLKRDAARALLEAARLAEREGRRRGPFLEAVIATFPMLRGPWSEANVSLVREGLETGDPQGPARLLLRSLRDGSWLPPGHRAEADRLEAFAQREEGFELAATGTPTGATVRFRAALRPLAPAGGQPPILL
ncbi:MAG: serine/threonine-protein kinase, partial [Planctomycetota bacterium]